MRKPTFFYKTAYRRISLFFCLTASFFSFSQLPAGASLHTANGYVPPYNAEFGYGTNMGVYPPYADENLADIAAGNPYLKVAGVGANALRPTLPERFLEKWGYNIRSEQFKYYESLGMKNNVVFLGYPSDQHQDTTVYCSDRTTQSTLFKNMYAPIWKAGKEGMEINDTNYYASYIFKTVKIYKNQVRFWEVWNEPDFATTYNPFLPAGQPGSWWSQDPDPCEYSLHAPVQQYIRMLRISYEVIKSLDSNAYVTIGGVGFPSFLDAVLRQTDNPDHGKVSAAYPLAGGAYFDVLSYHEYPHTDNSVREWSDKIQGFVYFRNSDRAATGVLTKKEDFKQVLLKYGYDGLKYPQKLFIITECNVPAKAFGDFMGGYEVQRNFIVKALIKTKQAGVLQFHVFSISQQRDEATATSEFDQMGLYYPLEGQQLYTTKLTQEGVAFKTAAALLKGFEFDGAATTALALPQTVDGAVFKDLKGGKIYALWAKTTLLDNSEQADAAYSFPTAAGLDLINQKNWDFSATGEQHIISSKNIKLTGAPSFFRSATISSTAIPAKTATSIFPNPSSGEIFLNYTLLAESPTSLYIYDSVGRLAASVWENQMTAAGLHQWRWQSERLPDGWYVANLVINGKFFTEKFVITSQ